MRFYRIPTLPAGATGLTGIRLSICKGTGGLGRYAAACARHCAAFGGRLLRVPTAAQRRGRALEADAAGRALPELYTCGKAREEGREGGTNVDAQVDVPVPSGSAGHLTYPWCARSLRWGWWGEEKQSCSGGVIILL